jgi:predicted nucleic acid-binding protein
VADARGDLAFDAQIAAVRHEHGARHILTLDRDFSRFPELTVLTVETPPGD